MAVGGENTRRPPPPPSQRGQKIIVNQSKTYFRYSLGKAFHSPEFQAKLFIKRNWVGGFYWDSLLNH